MKKEWIKPVVKWVVLDDRDIVCASPTPTTGTGVQELSDGGADKQGMWD